MGYFQRSYLGPERARLIIHPSVDLPKNAGTDQNRDKDTDEKDVEFCHGIIFSKRRRD